RALQVAAGERALRGSYAQTLGGSHERLVAGGAALSADELQPAVEQRFERGAPQVRVVCDPDPPARHVPARDRGLWFRQVPFPPVDEGGVAAPRGERVERLAGGGRDADHAAPTERVGGAQRGIAAEDQRALGGPLREELEGTGPNGAVGGSPGARVL